MHLHARSGNDTERIPTTPPPIPPLPLDDQRPLWSVMIPVYNCANYLRQALQSVLVQDWGEGKMQIEVVDDASTDANIEDLVNKVSNGRVSYFKQEKNVGSLRNFETCIKRSRGKLVHLLHADDCVKPGFYNEIHHLLRLFPKAGAFFTNYSFINEVGEVTGNFGMKENKPGILENWLIRIAEKQRIQYAAMVVRREVYEQLGSFYAVNCGEDWEMWVRIAKHYPVAYSPDVLAEYRGHSGSLTWEKAIAGEIYKDLMISIHNIQEHLSEKDKALILKKSKSHCANFLIGLAKGVWTKNKDPEMTKRIIQQALILYKSKYIYLRVIKCCLSLHVYNLTKNIQRANSHLKTTLSLRI